MLRATVIISLLALQGLAVCMAADHETAALTDSVTVQDEDESFYLPRIIDFRKVHQDSTLNTLQKVTAYGNIFVRFIDEFDKVDTAYIERNRYNFTAMLQGTTNYEFYTLDNRQLDYRLGFAQHPDYRIGPYFGWKWLFLGYTFDVSNIGTSRKQTSRLELSIYTSMIGVDLMWRQTGNDFYLRRVDGFGREAMEYEGHDTRYIRSKMRGVNMYYIFNHRRFSNPAVYSQSTIQRRSAGTWQVGAAITFQDIAFDPSQLPEALFASSDNVSELSAVERIKYTDYSVNCGYAYNYVFHRDWCLGISVLPAISYKWFSTKTIVLTPEEEEEEEPTSPIAQTMDEIFRKRGNVHVGGTARMGIIYNNGRWFAGAFGILHNYNYSRSDLHFSNTFGTLNLCVGLYFQRKKTVQDPNKPIKGAGVHLGM